MRADDVRLQVSSDPRLLGVIRGVIQVWLEVLGLLIDQSGVALGEGAAVAILARQTHRMAVHQERAEGQRLGGGPVDARAAVDQPALSARLDAKEALASRPWPG